MTQAIYDYLGRIHLGYSGIKIYSGKRNYIFRKRLKFFVCQTNDYSWYSEYSDALTVCYMKMLADFLSLSNFSNEHRRLRQVTSVSDFHFRWSLDFLPPYSLLLAPKRFSAYNLHFWKAFHAPCIHKLTAECPLCSTRSPSSPRQPQHVQLTSLF